MTGQFYCSTSYKNKEGDLCSNKSIQTVSDNSSYKLGLWLDLKEKELRDRGCFDIVFTEYGFKL